MNQRCTHCGGRILLERGYGGEPDEWRCLQCSRSAGVVVAAIAPVAHTSEYTRCEVCGSRQRGKASMVAHIRSSHGGTTRQGKRGPALGAVAPAEISAVYGKPR